MSEEKDEVWHIGYTRTDKNGKKFFCEQKAKAATFAEASAERNILREKLGDAPDEQGCTYSDFGLRPN